MTSSNDLELLAAARQGDPKAFERLTAKYQRQLRTNCYRMLGSIQDAEDALQETLIGAWRGLSGFEERSSLRNWLYRISTHACLRQLAQRPRRVLSPEHCPPRQGTADLGEVVAGPVWLEPWPEQEPASDASDADPAAVYERREHVELAFIAALQHLPGTQRAVLILRDVLQFSAVEVAEMLEMSAPAVNSARQRATATLEERRPSSSQRVELEALGAEGRQRLVDSFVSAWQRADLPALIQLLTEDVRFAMPPLPAWFEGRQNVARFFRERVFATPWRLVPLGANGQLGFACYLGAPGSVELRLGAINVLTLRGGKISEITGFLDPGVHRGFGVPAAVGP